ncbi:serine/threonine-protein kinase, partial [Zoogloea sp.]|uniref:serine/threonine protein kinase n=1 Tax=Zoogloea sp. TaxID=49181 RepID=UPI0014167B85
MSDNTDDRTVVLSAKPAAAKPAGQSLNALPPGTRFFDFEIVGLIGEGGFGIVYLAKDLSLQREVAIKEYMPSSLAVRENDTTTVVVRSDRHSETFEIGRNSFVNEARLLAQFDHPALVKVFQFWEANGTAYMAMPYFQGQTLRDVLKARTTPPDEAWIRQVLSPVMDALALIHQGNCFHRDIAPDNIMLLADGRPVLLDFGAARRVIGDMTQALTVILKPGYAPVEQYAEIPGVKQGAWTDVYALGAVVYFIITGRTPPPSVGRMMQDSYEPLEKVAAGRYSDTFLRGIDRCLAVKCEDRPQSIAAMREAIGFAAEGGAVAPAAPQPAVAAPAPAAKPTGS